MSPVHVEKIDTKRWITNLPGKMKQVPISQLCIPGSHDSFTNSLDRNSGVGPDQPNCVQNLGREFPSLTKKILPRWCFTQNVGAQVQLESGIRYFDLRMCAKEEGDTNIIVIIHILTGCSVGSLLEEIRQFLVQNPHEFVIIDCQHFYGFRCQDHKAVVKMIGEIFQAMICPCPATNDDPLTVSQLNERGHQVIVIYPNFGRPGEIFWPRDWCPTPWANTRSTKKLKAFLRRGLEDRDPSQLFVSQAVLTPTLSFIILNLFSDLKRSLVIKCNKATNAWLNSLTPDSRWPNIIIMDFVSCDQGFSEQIINRLLSNMYSVV